MKSQFPSYGFTLIEVLIYLGICSLLLLGTLSAVVTITATSERNKTRAFIAQEGAFLMQKVGWLIDTSDTFSAISENTLTVEKDGENIRVSSQNGTMSITYEGDESERLSSTQVQVDDFSLTSTNTHITLRFTLSATDSRGILYSEEFFHTWYSNHYP